MKLSPLVRRRPSAPIIVSSLALFVSLGGAGYAATVVVPANSVGTSQLQNGSVTNWKIANGVVGNWKLTSGAVGTRKIANGAVGVTQINTGQVQARVAAGCTTGAISAIDTSGKVSCVSTPPQEFGTTSISPQTLAGSTSKQIASKALPGGSTYLVLAYPHAVIDGSVIGQQVQVDCTLSVSPSNGATLTKSLTVQVESPASILSGSIPLAVPAPSVANGSLASVSCTDSYTGGTAPSVQVDTTLNAIQTAGNS